MGLRIILFVKTSSNLNEENSKGRKSRRTSLKSRNRFRNRMDSQELSSTFNVMI